jgi:hypothetical protein
VRSKDRERDLYDLDGPDEQGDGDYDSADQEIFNFAALGGSTWRVGVAVGFHASPVNCALHTAQEVALAGASLLQFGQ